MYVEGDTPTGTAPTRPPVIIGGVDGSGLVKRLLVGSDGGISITSNDIVSQLQDLNATAVGLASQTTLASILTDTTAIKTSVAGTLAVDVTDQTDRNLGVINGLPAAAPATDGQVVFQGLDKVYFDNGSGFTALTVTFASFSRNTNADGAAIVNLTSSKKITVLSLFLIAAGATSIKFQSSTSNSTGTGSNTDLTGLMSLAANGGFVLPHNPAGWFQTVSGEALKLNSSSTNVVAGALTYVNR